MSMEDITGLVYLTHSIRMVDTTATQGAANIQAKVEAEGEAKVEAKVEVRPRQNASQERTLESNLNHANQEAAFSISVLQEPVQGRMSGLAATSSRRILDPPLIIRLNIESIANHKPSEWQLRNATWRFVCSVVLYHESEMEQLAVARSIEGKTEDTWFHNNLLGLSCRNCSYFDTPEEERKTLFVFPDLAVRLYGHYRFRCIVSDTIRYDRFCAF